MVRMLLALLISFIYFPVAQAVLGRSPLFYSSETLEHSLENMDSALHGGIDEILGATGPYDRFLGVFNNYSLLGQGQHSGQFNLWQNMLWLSRFTDIDKLYYRYSPAVSTSHYGKTPYFRNSPTFNSNPPVELGAMGEASEGNSSLNLILREMEDYFKVHNVPRDQALVRTLYPGSILHSLVDELDYFTGPSSLLESSQFLFSPHRVDTFIDFEKERWNTFLVESEDPHAKMKVLFYDAETGALVYQSSPTVGSNWSLLNLPEDRKLKVSVIFVDREAAAVSDIKVKIHFTKMKKISKARTTLNMALKIDPEIIRKLMNQFESFFTAHPLLDRKAFFAAMAPGGLLHPLISGQLAFPGPDSTIKTAELNRENNFFDAEFDLKKDNWNTFLVRSDFPSDELRVEFSNPQSGEVLLQTSPKNLVNWSVLNLPFDSRIKVRVYLDGQDHDIPAPRKVTLHLERRVEGKVRSQGHHFKVDGAKFLNFSAKKKIFCLRSVLQFFQR